VFALKRFTGRERRLLVEAQVCAYLERRGFHKTAPLLRTLNGDPFLRLGGERWTLSDWREGRELAYGVPGDLARGADTLAEFHLAGLGFSPDGRSLRTGLGKRTERLRRRVGELAGWVAEAQACPTPGEVEGLLRQAGSGLVRRAEGAVQALERSAYTERCAWAEEARPLCHGDPSSRNLILGPDGVAYLIDLGSVKTDLPEADLHRLLFRALHRLAWDPEIARKALVAYAARAPFGEAERSVLAALFQFPSRVFRLLKQHHVAGESAPGGAAGADGQARAHLARKARRAIADLPQWEAFLSTINGLSTNCLAVAAGNSTHVCGSGK
jgi:CotS family spore coat protein